MKISNWILASTLCGFISAGGSAVFAQPISHFNVTGVPQIIQPGGDSIDLTIEAIGGDGQIVNDWNGEVSLSFLIPQETPVISELENFYNHPSKLEITNPGLGSMDLSSWKIRCLESYLRHVSPIFEFDLPENTILPPQSVMIFADDQSPDAFGDGLLVKYPGQFPITMFNGVTQLVNPNGNVVDEIFIEGPVFHESFRYDALWTKFYSIKGFIYAEKTIIRHGKDNHFTSDDWIIVHSDESNFGELNPGLELPWEHESLRIPLESEPLQLVDGKWSGSISTPADLPSGSVLIRAYTARGAIGTSTLAEVLAFPKLDWSLPEGFEAASENDAGQIVEAELSIPSSQDTDVTINITSLGVGEFDFPESVTIPAGTTFVKVPFTILDDELVDGLTP